MLINSAGGLGQAYNMENHALQRQNSQTASHKNQKISPESTVEISAEAKIRYSQEGLEGFRADDMFSEDELRKFEEINSLMGDAESTNRLKGLLAVERYIAMRVGQTEPKLDTGYINDLIKKVDESNSYFGMDLKYLYSVRDYFNGYKAR